MSDLKPLSLGENIIRTKFAANDAVSELKNKYATLFNEVIGLIGWKGNTEEAAEEERTARRALDLLEESAMFAVKSLTTRI